MPLDAERVQWKDSLCQMDSGKVFEKTEVAEMVPLSQCHLPSQFRGRVTFGETSQDDRNPELSNSKVMQGAYRDRQKGVAVCCYSQAEPDKMNLPFFINLHI